MILEDLHTHTTYCDGNNSPEEMILAAIDMNMDTIGFSAHSYTFFDERYCLKKERTEEYKSEIKSLKNKYKNRIRILCGIEQDFYSDMPTNDYDYVIGSVHYIKVKNEYIPVDDGNDILQNAANVFFNNDIYSFLEEYYKTVSDVVKVTQADIIGHFDLVSKYNDGNVLFDANNNRYINAWQTAVNKLVTYSTPFEINTGAVSKGYKSTPYPSEDILQFLIEKNARFIMSSDSHSNKTLCFGFDKYKIDNKLLVHCSDLGL